MSTLYLLALAAVALAIFGLLLDSISQVRRRLEWPTGGRVDLQVVATVDRQVLVLPFVGEERRDAPRSVNEAWVSVQARRGA